jgi:hypothetical protein
MLSGAHFHVFEKYKDAKAHAFATGIVTESDKDIYQEVFSALIEAAEQSISSGQFNQWFRVWSARFHRNGGMQGQRPVDLWACVINKESDVFLSNRNSGQVRLL